MDDRGIVLLLLLFSGNDTAFPINRNLRVQLMKWLTKNTSINCGLGV